MSVWASREYILAQISVVLYRFLTLICSSQCGIARPYAVLYRFLALIYSSQCGTVRPTADDILIHPGGFTPVSCSTERAAQSQTFAGFMRKRHGLPLETNWIAAGEI